MNCNIQLLITFRYGAIKIGLVLAGIAAGLQSQSVSQNNLFKLAARGKNFRRPPVLMERIPTSSTGTSSVSNKWVATLSGRLQIIILYLYKMKLY